MRLDVRRRLRSAGFTLMELLITITILVILTAVAVPSLTRMIHKNRIIGTANEIVAIGRFAQNEAMIRKQRIILLMEKTNPHHWFVYIQPNIPNTSATDDTMPPNAEVIRELWLDDRLTLIPDEHQMGKFNKIQFLPNGSMGGVTTDSEKVSGGRAGDEPANTTGVLAICSDSFPQETIDVYFGGKGATDGRKVESLTCAKSRPEEKCKQLTQCEAYKP